MTAITNHLKNLKDALLTLHPSGANGFEGLIAVTLQAICGVPFRLASSGSQHGLDGAATYSSDSICFEAKRYDSSIPKNEVISKIAELSLDCDLWILGATQKLSAQHADACNKLSARLGISILILDWDKSAVSPFAAALAMAGQKVEEFLKLHLTKDLQLGLDALGAVRSNADFPKHSAKIRFEVSAASTGIPLARRANCEWLDKVFSTRQSACNEFRQPLCPGDSAIFQSLPRQGIVESLRASFMDTPKKTVTIVHAGEGSGKSWVVAQTYLALPEKPITLFLMPRDVPELASNEFRTWLIGILVRQTGEDSAPEKVNRWRRKLERWVKLPRDETRIVLVLDGINQQPNRDWSRIVDKLTSVLEELGGRLIVTTRTHYFQNIRARIGFAVTEIPVPEWTIPERNQLLELAGIQFQSLQVSAARQLCNPRLLGIAITLYRNGELTDIAEFSVNRMMFEHIRACERDSPEPRPAREFFTNLKTSANVILTRLREGDQDDLRIFEGELNAVVDGRFFVPVPNDPSRYTLTDEGLVLALGLAVRDLLLIAIRNNRDLDATLAEIIEPIAALDITAKVIFAAIMVNSRDCYSQEMDVALLKSFADMQNPEQTDFEEFEGFARRRLSAFMTCTRDLCLMGARQANFAWFDKALMIVSNHPEFWCNMVPELQLWLSHYTDSPDLTANKRWNSAAQEEVEAERVISCAKIKSKIDDLSAAERELFEGLILATGNLDELSMFAFYLLAGKALAPVAAGLMNWCFSVSFNSGWYCPRKEFTALVQFNTIDWAQTQMALLTRIDQLKNAKLSKTGLYAISNAYFATGDSDNEDSALEIQKELDRPKSPTSARFVETLCSVDPCDPNSTMPLEVQSTSEKFSAIDVGEISVSRENSVEQSFFKLARACLARFSPIVFISKQRDLISNVLNRKGTTLKYGLFGIHDHSALLSVKNAQTLIDIRTHRAEEDLTVEDKRLISQLSLLLAFPYFDESHQFNLFISLNDDESVLADLIDAIKPMSPSQVELLLDAATSATDQNKQIALINAARNYPGALSQASKSHLRALMDSPASGVRAQTFAMIAETAETDLLKTLVESAWNANTIIDYNSFEPRYGSIALLRAAKLNMIADLHVVERISPALYGQAASLLGDEARYELAKQIDIAITKATNDCVVLGPDSRVNLCKTDSRKPFQYSVLEPESEKPVTFESWLDELGNEDHGRRKQTIRNDAHEQFRGKTHQAGLGIALTSMSVHEFSLILDTDLVFRERWFQLLIALPDAAFRLLHHLAVLLANALSHGSPAQSAKLFQRSKRLRAAVDVRNCWSDICFAQAMLWNGARSDELDRVRFAELNCARNDHELAMSVLAALMANQTALLDDYIAEKLASVNPSDVARAIMVVGFSDITEKNDQRLAAFHGKSGLVGKAYKAAIYAYQRNAWAKHWFARICQSHCNDDFWCNSVLLAKIVDGRFELWNGEFERAALPVQQFRLGLENQVKSRITKWEHERKKKLFGEDPPADVFLRG